MRVKTLLLAVCALLSGPAFALSADLPKAPPAAPAYLDQTFTWTGFLFGVEAGYGTSNLTFAGLSANNGAFLAGGVVDLLYQLKGTSFVLGNELRFGRQFQGSIAGFNADNWLGTGELLAGFTPSQYWLLYVTGGASYQTANIGPFSDAALGPTIGAGVKYAIPQTPFVLGAKYNYVKTTGANFLGVGEGSHNFALDLQIKL